MTKNDIIDMAKEAGCEIRNGHIYNKEMGSLDQLLKRFTKLVAEKEREACASIDFRAELGVSHEDDSDISRLIRARG
jgi:hypothetical protein